LPLPDTRLEMNVIEYINSLVTLAPDVAKKIQHVFTNEEGARKTFLYKEGQTATRLYYIQTGLARMYYLNDQGKEITYGFYTDGQFVTIPDSFFNQTPSRYYLELLETSSLSFITYSEFELLANAFSEVKEIENHVLRYFLLRASERIVALQFQTAEERYLTLFESQPSIFYRAPLGTIASYLGITQETLSRIRSKKIV
jgi:CRP-like cAMP-binding protein